MVVYFVRYRDVIAEMLSQRCYLIDIISEMLQTFCKLSVLCFVEITESNSL